MRNFLRDCTFTGPALPDPFVQFELEGELNKLGVFPAVTGASGRELNRFWEMYRRKLRPLISGGSIRVRNHVFEPLMPQLGYERIASGGEIHTREGLEDGGDLLNAADGGSLRVWCTEYDEDLDAPTRHGAAYRFSHLQVARRVLKAKQEPIGLLTNGTELRVIIHDLARTDSEIQVRIDPAWKERGNDVPDSLLLVLALASPAGVRVLPDLLDKARLQQARVTKELRSQARRAVEGFVQEILNHPDNQTKLGTLENRHSLAPELWREALIVVYRLLFILKLEATDDPARSFKFSTSTLWRNTFSPTSALPKFVRKIIDEGAVSGTFLEHSVRKLFEMFVDGLECSELHVRPLGGTLFGSQATPLLSSLQWGERAVAFLLDNLLWTAPRQRISGRERVHYGSLDVEDLGRVYEALLELEPGVASEPMCRLRRSKLEVVVPIAQGERYRVNAAVSDAEAEDDEEEEQEEPEEETPSRAKKTKVEWIEEIPAGRFYLRVGLGRKASGSYYTPQSFVRFLVQQTLEPLVEERSPKVDPKPAEILKIKVLDPAMGSGHFLVEACRFLGAKLYESARLCDERLGQARKTAEAAQNDAIREQAHREVADYTVRLAAFLPPDAKLPGYLPTSAPEAGESTGISQKYAEAICRRLVAIHCLYGVDKNPLGVELAKVAIWLESHAEGLPLTFLDHRLVLGDSLCGPMFHHLLTFPGSKRPMADLLTVGLRENFRMALGDALTLVQGIESTLCSTLPDFVSKERLRNEVETKLAPFKVVAAAWAGGMMLAEGCDDDSYAALVWTVADTGKLPQHFESAKLREMIGRGLGRNDVERDTAALLAAMQEGGHAPAIAFDLAFPEIFIPLDGDNCNAFDVVLGNPPWDAIQFKSNEFFASFDFAILECDTTAERDTVADRLTKDPIVNAVFEEYKESFERQKRAIDTLYRFQKVRVAGDLAGRQTDAFRVFLERNAQLLYPGARTGVVVPSAFHANEGATGVRQLYLRSMQIQCCYAFENRRKLFDIDGRQKFAVLVAIKGGQTSIFPCAFYVDDETYLFDQQRLESALRYTLELIVSFDRHYLSFPELRHADSVPVFKQLYDSGHTVGDLVAEKLLRLKREITDSDLRALDSSSAIDMNDWGCLADIVSVTKHGNVQVIKGEAFRHYDDRSTAFTIGTLPLKLIAAKPDTQKAIRFFRIATRKIARSNDERTFIPMLICPGITTSESCHTDQLPQSRTYAKSLEWLAVFSSFPFDWTSRQLVAANMNLFIIERLPMPISRMSEAFLAHAALRLTCNHAAYELLWRDQLQDHWREDRAPFSWPAIDNSEQRWNLVCAMDCVIARGYSLTRDQYAHVLAGFSHKAYLRAPDLCLTRFDELTELGIEAFSRKYDPYWDVPIITARPSAAIDFSLTPDGQQSQPALGFEADGNLASSSLSDHNEGLSGGSYDRLLTLFDVQRELTNRDVQNALGCSQVQASALLKRLVQEHHAIQEGRGRSTRYVAVPRSEVADANTAG